MSVLALRADAASYRLPDLSAEVRAEFALLQDLARDGLAEMRRMLGALQSTDDEADTAPQPGLDGIADMVARLRTVGMDIALDIRPGPDPVPAGLGLSAHRIVQESLSNSARHAPGAAVRVCLSTEGGALRIEVRTAPGTGPAPAPLEPEEGRPRHGLVGMRERARVLGGTLTAAPAPDGGFAVVAELPLNGEGHRR
jgi:signal transduction histidine kinase